jgi:SAM-dependent methyltransferase
MTSFGVRLLVFFSAFSCLMFELILSRLADFYIDFRNSYLALPITFLGLAMGSIHVHFRPALARNFHPARTLWALAGICYVTYWLLFGAFAPYFGIPASEGLSKFLALNLTKTAVFIVLFIAPFYIFGRILTTCYFVQREKIGLVYSADFFGAALACFLTPLLFHFVSLPEVVTALLGCIGGAAILLSGGAARRRGALAVVWAVALGGLYFGAGYFEGKVSYMYYTGENAPVVREISSRWNEFSRVQLVKFEHKKPELDYYKIIHDNARSNVHVEPYVPGATKRPRRFDALELPFILGWEPADVLVMFAGCGAEMVRIDQLAKGGAHITGVEINPACRDLARETPELRDYRLGEFYDRPNIDLQITEGRSFLERNTRQFDVIFVGSSAPTSLAFTGDTRKYMYTEEAMRQYLRALKPGGMILFDHQPTSPTIETLKHVFEQMGRRDFAQCAMLFRSSNGRNTGTPDLAVCLGGFRREDYDRIVKAFPAAKEQILYAPDAPGIKRADVERMTRPSDAAYRVVDNQPYIERIRFGEYRLAPGVERLKDYRYYASWLRITTLLCLCVVAVLFMGLAGVSRARRLPPSVLMYLLLTGFAYLVVELVFMARLELFLQDPLVSMASVISIFLLASGAGSLLHRQTAGAMGAPAFAVFTAFVVIACYLAIGFIMRFGMDWELPARLFAAFVAMTPAGLCLGMFYPHAVSRLVAAGRDSAVPMTYGVSTLSSVLGASYGMTMMINLGFDLLILQAAGVYLMLAAGLMLYRQARGERALL